MHDFHTVLNGPKWKYTLTEKIRVNYNVDVSCQETCYLVSATAQSGDSPMETDRIVRVGDTDTDKIRMKILLFMIVFMTAFIIHDLYER